MDNKQAGLKDVLNYTADQYFNETEISLIQSTFSNPAVIAVLRKVLLPTVSDPSMPIEDFDKDIFMQSRDYAAMSADETKAIVLGRQEAIKFIIGGLIKLKVMSAAANAATADTPQAKELRKAKDGNK